MNRLFDIKSQIEGRKLEFKETLPSKSDLAKTIISFANDAGGELYLTLKEPGIAFRVIFTRKDFKLQQELQQELQLELQQESQQESLYSKVIRLLIDKPLSRKEISTLLGQKAISGQLNEVLGKLLNDKLIEWSLKDNPNSPKQKHLIIQRGIVFIKSIEKRNEI